MKSFKGAPSGPTVCYSVTVNVTPTSLATLAGGFQNVAIPASPGCNVGQRVFICPDSDISNAGYFIGAPRISAANVVRIQQVNATATNPLAPAALDLNFVFLGQNSAV